MKSTSTAEAISAQLFELLPQQPEPAAVHSVFRTSANLLYQGQLVTLLDESWLHHLLLGWTDSWEISGMAAIHLGMCVLIVGELVYGAIFYFLTTYFLKRRLNLE